jgi:protein-L-isoaspartate O-methyltransferase
VTRSDSSLTGHCRRRARKAYSGTERDEGDCHDRRDRPQSVRLGYSEEEQERLIRQARRLAPWTRRLFRTAGISAGQRVLDVGSGIGDVSMILSEIVGPEGSVLGLERDAGSIATAQSRVAKAGIHNVSFLEAEALDPPLSGTFDAIVGRFILMYMPDPSLVLHELIEY